MNTAVVQAVRIPLSRGHIEGMLELPDDAHGLVLFAHGSGSSRHSPRNYYVARVLRKGGIGTLLMDLLTPEEDAVYETRFDIALLTRRLLAATRWLRADRSSGNLPLGYFGASTGAAAALQAAAQPRREIRAVVSRGGRPDMAGRQDLQSFSSPDFAAGGRER